MIVTSNPLATTLQLQGATGLVVPGVSFAKVTESTSPTGSLIVRPWRSTRCSAPPCISRSKSRN